MKKIRSHKHAQDPEEEILPEYCLDYSKARPNRFAARSKAERHEVLLDPDVAEVFRTSESVNAVLRALIANMPKRDLG